MFPADNNLDFKVTMESDKAAISDDAPFHILLLGDWSGRANRADFENNNISIRPLEIDRDNFDEILKTVNAKLVIDIDEIPQTALTLTFTEIDDFHPDRIFKRIPIFSELRELRQRLSKSDTFEKAAEEVRLLFDTDKIEDSSQNAVEETEKIHSAPADLLDSILSQTKTEKPVVSPQFVDNSDLKSLISKVVKPFLVRTDEQEQSKLIAAVDETISDLMRKILHHPHFKELESSWRSLYFLVRSVETNSKLKIFLLDICKKELSSKLKSPDESVNADFYKVFENDENWALICGNYNFQINVDDVALLMRLATIASSINAPFISYMNPQVIQTQAISEIPDFNNLSFIENSAQHKLWNAIRNLPESGFIGLLIQKLLIRLPYGTETDPTENFSFEEFTDQPGQNDFLWANSYFAPALLLAQSFSANAWEMKKHLFQDIDGLPIHSLEQSGGFEQLPGSEFLLAQKLCEQLLEAGLMPLISFRDRETIRLARFQSIAASDKTLRGKWC